MCDVFLAVVEVFGNNNVWPGWLCVVAAVPGTITDHRCTTNSAD